MHEWRKEFFHSSIESYSIAWIMLGFYNVHDDFLRISNKSQSEKIFRDCISKTKSVWFHVNFLSPKTKKLRNKSVWNKQNFFIFMKAFLKSPLTFPPRRKGNEIWVINQNKQWSWMPKKLFDWRITNSFLFTLEHEGKKIRRFEDWWKCQ